LPNCLVGKPIYILWEEGATIYKAFLLHLLVNKLSFPPVFIQEQLRYVFSETASDNYKMTLVNFVVLIKGCLKC